MILQTKIGLWNRLRPFDVYWEWVRTVQKIHCPLFFVFFFFGGNWLRLFEVLGMGADNAKDSLPTAERPTQWSKPFCQWVNCVWSKWRVLHLFWWMADCPAEAGTAVSLKIGESATATAVICNIWRTIGLLGHRRIAKGKVSLNVEWVTIFPGSSKEGWHQPASIIEREKGKNLSWPKVSKFRFFGEGLFIYGWCTGNKPFSI